MFIHAWDGMGYDIFLLSNNGLRQVLEEVSRVEPPEVAGFWTIPHERRNCEVGQRVVRRPSPAAHRLHVPKYPLGSGFWLATPVARWVMQGKKEERHTWFSGRLVSHSPD